MKRYDKEFRERALRLSDEFGIKKASEQLGAVYGTLADWRKKRVMNKKICFTKVAEAPTSLQRRTKVEMTRCFPI